VLFQVETIMGMETVNETEIENVGESHVIPVETAGTTERAGILEITETVPGIVGITKTIGTVLIPGYLGTAGIQGRTEKLLGRKSVRKHWNVAVNVSVNVSVNVRRI
jgi:hypothetical protein